MRRLLVIIIVALISTLLVQAQAGPPDYGIQNIQPAQFTAADVEIRFDVVNSGGVATDDADVIALLVTERGDEVARQPVPSLDADESVTLTLSFPLSDFAPGSRQSLEITLAGLDQVEAPLPETEANNHGSIGVTMPSSTGMVAPQVTPAAGGSGLLGIPLDFSNPITIGVAAGMVVAAIFLLVIVIAILRLLFRSPATFATWQPPYANIPFLDPNTTPARRQGWQPHAQNDWPPPPMGEGATHVRKLLTGIDGTSLGNWQMTGARLNQYDQYGRITRSQYIAPSGLMRRFSKLITQAPTLSSDELVQRVRPLAGKLAYSFTKQIVPRSATLPIALDVRLQGTYGEVRVLFELFYVQGGQWRKIDQWEPEIALVDKGRRIEENLTYTIYGLRGGEAFKDFPERLRGDLTRIFVDMIKHPDAQRAPTPPATQNANIPT